MNAVPSSPSESSPQSPARLHQPRTAKHCHRLGQGSKIEGIPVHALTVASRFNSSWNNNSKCSYHTKFIAAARRETRRLLCTDFQLAAHAPYSDRADKRAHGGTYILLVGVGWTKVRVSISISVVRTKSFSQTLCHEVKLVRRARHEPVI
jgi:hypothetical protein